MKSYCKHTRINNRKIAIVLTLSLLILIGITLYISGILQNSFNAFADVSNKENSDQNLVSEDGYYDGKENKYYNGNLTSAESKWDQKSDVAFMVDETQDSAKVSLSSTNQNGNNVLNMNAKICGPLFGGISEYNVLLNFDYKWLYEDPNTSYNSNLAMVANMLSTDIYKYAYVKAISGKGAIGSSKTDADYTYLLKDLGFDDVKFIELANLGWENDKNDVGAIVLAHKTIATEKGNKDIFINVIRGTQNSGEWTSDLDVGSTSQDYERQTGPHPYWMNKNHHKGFDVFSNRISEQIDKYIAQHSSQNSEKSILITGHSRGAAAANILGQMYEDRQNIKPYTYAFSCPLTTLQPKNKAQSYKTIFNFCEKNDLVGHVPLQHWGFTRYGNDIIGDSFADGVYKKTIEEMMNHTFYDSDKSNVIKGLDSIVDNIDDIYSNRQDVSNLSPEEAQIWIQILGISDCYKVLPYDSKANAYPREYNDGFFLKASSKILEDMMSLFVKDGSIDNIQNAFNAVQSSSDVNSLLQNNSLNLALVKDLVALKVLVAGTNCEEAYNAFSNENKVEMLMPHLTATTLALAKITPSADMVSGTSYGSGNIILICVLAALGLAAIIITVVVVKKRKSCLPK